MPSTNYNNPSLWTALITPFNGDGSVDYDSLKTLLEQQNNSSNGILLLGSTGESLALTLEERKQVLNFAIENKKQSPYMVGVGGIGHEEQLDWINYLNSIDIDCYLVVTPLYAKPGKLGQKTWFKNMLDKAQRPCVLYNVPSRTGVKMNFEAVEELKDHKNFWAIKEASGSTEDFERYANACPNIKMFSGDDALLPAFSQIRCEGLISVASNVWPSETHQYVNQCLEKKYDQVKDWEAISNSLFIAANPIPAKAILKEKKIIKEAQTRLPLVKEDLASIGPLIEADQMVQNWVKKNNL